MSVGKLVGLAFLCAAGMVAPLEARNLFVVLPGEGLAGTLAVYAPDPLTQIGTVTSNFSRAHTVLPNGDGSKYYVITRSGTDTVIVVRGDFTGVGTRHSLGQSGEAAAITPNGRRLAVAAGRLFLFDTANDVEVVAGGLDVGGDPSDVAASHDSTRAFVVSRGSQRLTSVDLSTNGTAATLTFSEIPNNVAVGPNGLVYVSAASRVFEIDGRRMSSRREFSVTGRPGRLVFTPDGRWALAVNQLYPVGPSAYLFDLTTGSRTEISAGDALEQLLVVNSNRVVARSSTRIYEIAISPLSVTEAFYSLSGVVAAAVSDEVTDARYLFLLTTLVVRRVDLRSSGGAPSQVPISATDRPSMVMAGPPSTAAAANLIRYNNDQTIPQGGSTLPLVIRALDVNGRPVANAPVTWTTSSADVVLQNSSSATNNQGYAQTVMVAPLISGVYIVTAAVGNLSASFTVTATTGAGVAGLVIVSGQGQMVGPGATAPDPLLVRAQDAGGLPISGVSVTFEVPSGSGSLSQGDSGTLVSQTGQSVIMNTDDQGRASVKYQGIPLIPTGTTYIASTVKAFTASSGSVDFRVTTVPLVGGFLGASTELVKPAIGERRIVGQIGQTITGAVQVRVSSSVIPGLGIPQIALRATTDQDPLAGPTASCVGAFVFTGADGVATCDLILGGRTGTTTLRLVIGSQFEFRNIVLEVNPGAPGEIRILQGNNQSGTPGQRLPVALTAQVTDASGNPLASADVQWEVVTPSAVSLSNIVSTSDSEGRVSAVATLGSTPGEFKVRVKAGSAVGTFTLRVVLTVGQVVKISGEPQTATVNQNFAQPLVVEVRDPQGRVVPNVTVSFTGTGGATVSPANVTTNAQGQASTTVRAGGTEGTIQVTAIAGNQTAVFNLTVRPLGPVITTASFLNGASFQRGLVGGGVTAIVGTGLTPAGLTGCVTSGNIAGPLPTRLMDVEVRFGVHVAGIYAVCNVSGQETIYVQAPFALAPGMVPVRVQMGNTATQIDNVPVLAAQPGIFETTYDGRRYAVVVRANGTFMTPSNPLEKGETARAYVNALGPVVPAADSNQPGAGQPLLYPVIVGINNAGVRLISARYAVNMIGVYEVEFEVPADAPSGAEIPFKVVSTPAEGEPVHSPSSRIAIR